ncbi:MAG: PAS domain S-box protein [Rhodoferax sp.]|uniref:CHASE domain-containing hybrid sensor histidine kinase/response regulator n=1 Tax=Rhodoferax sp. TaxID=50421 RepID=UPI0027269E35|nr:PAS domain S-box protein [Rhodoferax sp.]MDO8447240.1 PAS domain S-box protein [Rhodoferax sp.]
MLWTLVMLVSGLSLTAYSVHATRQRLNAEARLQFNRQFDRLEESVRAQFNQPLYGIRGAIGAQASTGVMRRANFRAYVASRDIAAEFPGIRGFGYIERVMRPDLGRFEAAEQADQAPGFVVKTSGGADEMYVIKYLEPQAGNRAAEGLDAGAEPMRREAIERAINSGQPSLSGAMTLVQDGRQGAGFIYLVPVYRDGITPDTPKARRAALIGLFYSPLVANELLLNSTFVANGVVDFELMDGLGADAETLVFSSEKTVAASTGRIRPADFKATRAFHKSRIVPIGGRFLTLRAGSSAVFESNLDRITPRLVGIGGAALSLLLATIAWLLLVGRARAESLVRAKTLDLDRLVGTQKATNEELGKAIRESRALMETIDQHSIVSITDPAGNITYVNEMFSRISGYSSTELLGQNHRIVKSDEQPDEFWTTMWTTVSSGYVWRGVICNRTKDGSRYWVDSVIAPFFDDKGAIEKYVSIRADITAAKVAQQDLAAERERLSHIITGTNAGTWEWNVQTDELVINERWADIIGYAIQELAPASRQTWTNYCHPDDLQQATQLLTQHIEGGLGYYDCEMRMRHRDGHWVWIHSRGKTSSWTADGKPEWMSGTHLDISKRKQAEEDLRRNNTVMQSILDNIPVGLSAFDSDLNLIAKNRLFQTHLDFPDELFSGPTTTFESIIRFNADRGEYGEGDHEETIQTIVERARHPEPHQFERVRPNSVILNVRGAPMPGGGFVTTYTDISQRKQAEAEIARTTAMLQSVLDAASEVAVITTGLDRTITLFNKGAERMLGYSAAEVVGLHSAALFFDEQEVAARADVLSVELGRPITGFAVVTDESTLGRRVEWSYLRKNGDRITVALVVTPLFDTLGVRTGYLGISHDISTEKDYENWLRTAMEDAEAATVAKSQFLANMSHEIRTPMNAILGMLKLLQNTELSARQLDYATKTEGAARSLLGLLNDILDFSKMDAGKMALDPQPFRLDDLMRDLSVILSASIGKKPLEVLFDIDPATPKLLIGDSMRLQQVLVNLAGNAIKFTAQGEVVIQIKVLARTGPDTTLQISVRDSGIGIAPENQKHIFDGFSQAEASTTRRFGGTGLGLSISRRLVELMGGELGLHSVFGQGSTFHFTVTLPATDQVPEGAEMSTLRPLTSLNVLVVDDNPVALEVLAAMARSCGWQVDAAGSGAEAIRLVEARANASLAPYQAIFVDWQMPDMDGWETSLQIRQLAPAAGAPIMVMVTAHGREMLSQRTQDEQTRLNGFLVKPVTASMLFDAVAEAGAGHSNLRAGSRSKNAKLQRLEGLRLLVVEDNLINQQVAQELLSAEGALVELAANGQLGVAAVAGADPQFDAVLMDLQMPVMDGYTATRAIRHELGLLHLPIIAMTANAMATDREACLAAGMNDHVGKPIDLPHLIRVLQNHVRRTAGTTAPPALPMTADATLPGAVAKSPAATLPPVDAVDVDGALERLGDNTELYARILQSYLDEIRSLPDQLDAFLLGGDLAGATRLLHTLKGLSATVGADYLAAVARTAESAVKDADTTLAHDDLRASFREAVASTGRIMSQIAQNLTQPAPEESTAAEPALDTAQWVADLRDLQRLLKSSDMRALDAHAQLRRIHAHGAADELQALDAGMAAFDFAQGVIQCDILIRKFSPSI